MHTDFHKCQHPTYLHVYDFIIFWCSMKMPKLPIPLSYFAIFILPVSNIFVMMFLDGRNHAKEAN